MPGLSPLEAAIIEFYTLEDPRVPGKNLSEPLRGAWKGCLTGGRDTPGKIPEPQDCITMFEAPASPASVP